jgi:pimeloyl-ACP methyl ester carboxylesterase
VVLTGWSPPARAATLKAMPTNPSRRHVLKLGATVLAATAVPARAPDTGLAKLSTIRIRTPAGTFDAVAAGPRHGRKVLLLHGFPEFGIMWEHQLHALAAAGYRAVAPDQRGYSPGVRPAGITPYRLDHAVADVRAIADSLGWRRFDLVGHDWGAVVAWIAAARCPHRIRSLIAVSVPHPAAFAEALRVDPAQQAASAYMDIFRQPSPIPENWILEQGPPPLPGVSPERRAEYFRRLSEPGALTAALNWYRANDFQGFTEPVTVPTLFIASTADENVAPYGIQATHRWVNGPYRLVTLDGIQHNVPEEAAEQTSALVLGHLASRPRPT